MSPRGCFKFSALSDRTGTAFSSQALGKTLRTRSLGDCVMEPKKEQDTESGAFRLQKNHTVCRTDLCLYGKHASKNWLRRESHLEPKTSLTFLRLGKSLV